MGKERKEGGGNTDRCEGEGGREREMNKVDLLTLVGGRTEKEGKWANDNENKENKVSQ